VYTIRVKYYSNPFEYGSAGRDASQDQNATKAAYYYFYSVAV